jgi:hypothetical protein
MFANVLDKMRFNAFLSFVGGRLSSWNEDIILDSNFG